MSRAGGLSGGHSGGEARRLREEPAGYAERLTGVGVVSEGQSQVRHDSWLGG